MRPPDLALAVLVLCLASASPSRGQIPACGPIELRAGIPRSERTEILVLGTQHLRRIEALDPATLDPLLDALAAWRPDAIGVETLPPAQIAAMERLPAYGPVLAAFAADELAAGRAARDETGLDWVTALARADSLEGTLASASPGERPAIRRALVPLLMAAYRLDDAALQWSFLDDPDAGAGAIPDTLRAHLERRLAEGNETTAIGIALAERLGLERLHPIDDHLDKDRLLAIADALTAELEESVAYREVVGSGALEASTRDLIAAHATGDLLPYYLALNEPAAQERDIDLQWRLFFRTRLPSGLDRQRVALWEVRNLAMVQHVRRASAPHPGGRVLVVVGASHKPFLDAYLSCGMDVEVVHLAEIVGSR